MRAREALNTGQITGSPALVAAQGLLAKCRGTRLLRLPKSAAEIQASRYVSMYLINRLHNSNVEKRRPVE